MSTLSVQGLKDVGAVLAGLVGAIVGETVVTQKMGQTSDIARFAGGAGGALITGAAIGVAFKNVKLGAKAAAGGLAYVIAKIAYNKLLAGKPIFGMIMPTMGDYVTMPEMGDYVTMPAEVGQFAVAPSPGAPFETAAEIGVGDDVPEYY